MMAKTASCWDELIVLAARPLQRDTHRTIFGIKLDKLAAPET